MDEPTAHQDRLNALLMAKREDARYRWCESNLCACMGCANGPGGITAAGFTREDWQAWVDAHPR